MRGILEAEKVANNLIFGKGTVTACSHCHARTWNLSDENGDTLTFGEIEDEFLKNQPFMTPITVLLETPFKGTVYKFLPGQGWYKIGETCGLINPVRRI